MATFQSKPLAADLLSNSQADIKGDFDYLQGVLGGAGGTTKDHQVAFGSTDATPAEGRHNSVGFIDRGVQAFPTDGLTGFAYATAGNLYYRNSTVGPIQLTTMGSGNISNSATNGSTFLPGGLILKWIKITSAPLLTTNAVHTSTAWTTAFPTACFNVQLTVDTSAFLVTPGAIGPFLTTSFQYYLSSLVAGSVTAVYAVAIGN